MNVIRLKKYNFQGICTIKRKLLPIRILLEYEIDY